MKQLKRVDRLLIMTLALSLSLLAAASFAQEPFRRAQAARPVATTDRLIVRLADWADAGWGQPMVESRARALSATARTRLEPRRRMSGGAHVVQLTHPMLIDEVERVATRLKADAAVLHAEPDVRKFPMLAATDPGYFLQWPLFEPAGGINAPAAWDVTTGSPSIVVAVLDTGVVPSNPDLVNRLATGWDFVREDAVGLFVTANDGDGRDANPSDPGDWVSQAEAGQAPFQECTQAQDSSWHGTQIAGIIGASANNNYGVAGVAWNVRLLPLRVLGKCGGYTSDVIDAARWAGGLSVPGVPANSTPAQVLNLSLGAVGPCSVEEQRAINDVLAAGMVKAIVTSSGNDGGNSAAISPGNCSGVIAVTAVDRAGSRASYASVGSNVALAAPGGFFPLNAVDGRDGILAISNIGTTTPGNHAFVFAIGTSEAAAHVSGVAALVLSANPSLTADALRTLLRQTARPFPDATCNTMTCGAGIVNAGAAVMAAAPAASAPLASDGGDGGGGGGGGGCTMARGGSAELVLPIAALWALLGIWRRRRMGWRAR